MNKASHNRKKHKARKMMKDFEWPKKNNMLHAGIFDSQAWRSRKEAIKLRIEKRIQRQKDRKLAKANNE